MCLCPWAAQKGMASWSPWCPLTPLGPLEHSRLATSQLTLFSGKEGPLHPLVQATLRMWDVISKDKSFSQKTDSSFGTGWPRRYFFQVLWGTGQDEEE